MPHVMKDANVKPAVDEQEQMPAFLGAWDLVTFEHVLRSGEATRPFGDSPSGLLVYQADGYMSAQVSTGNPVRLANDDAMLASDEEVSVAWRNYFGYWGVFTVRADEGVVVHRVEGSSFANWIGTEQVRQFRFEGTDRLILEAESPSGRYVLAWERRGG